MNTLQIIILCLGMVIVAFGAYKFGYVVGHSHGYEVGRTLARRYTEYLETKLAAKK